MSDLREALDRLEPLYQPPEQPYEDLVRRRDRKERNRRLSAGALAIIVASVSLAALARAYLTAERPADVPRPPGIFSEVGGWIAYGDRHAIWAVDPAHPDDESNRIRLSTDNRGTPLAWSSDGSKLLILSERSGSGLPLGLIVLDEDGTETAVATGQDWCVHVEEGPYCGDGGSLSPDGAQVVYAAPPEGTWRSAIHVVDSQGGAPRVLLTGRGRLYAAIGRRVLSWLSDPTYSPDGTQIAYFDHQLDGPSQLRVMNADGTGVNVLRDGTGYHLSNLTWSPDGERLYWGETDGIYSVGADGSDFTLMIPDATLPYWSPDGSRIAFQNLKESAQRECDWSTMAGTLSIADRDGMLLREFGFCAKSGPWNPLTQPDQEATEALASEGPTLTSALVVVVALLAMVVGALLIRRRIRAEHGRSSSSS